MSAFWSQFCIEKSRWERESCPLSGIEKRPPLGGYVSIKVLLDTIRNTIVVRCREAVLFSEGPLSEARLLCDFYTSILDVITTEFRHFFPLVIIVFSRTLLQTFLADRREGNSPPFIDFE